MDGKNNAGFKKWDDGVEHFICGIIVRYTCRILHYECYDSINPNHYEKQYHSGVNNSTVLKTIHFPFFN